MLDHSKNGISNCQLLVQALQFFASSAYFADLNVFRGSFPRGLDFFETIAFEILSAPARIKHLPIHDDVDT
jgi:hypothetical protein